MDRDADTVGDTAEVGQDELVGFLRGHRDEYEQKYKQARRDEDSFSNYYIGRYHAYVDVLAWMYGEGFINDD